MAVQRSLISPTAHPRLEDALRLKLQRRGETGGSLGELEPLAVQLGLIQNSLKPRLKAPQLVVFAGDHGMVADGLAARGIVSSQQVAQLLDGRLPIAVFSLLQGLTLTVVDAGLAETLAPSAGLQQRKIGFGTRSARLGGAMTIDQAHAAIRAGMELADTLSGNVLACAGIGLGAAESAALVLSRIGGVPLADLLATTPADKLQPGALAVLEAALAKHLDVTDPVEVLAALGGYELAMMVGAMLVAASKRHLLIIDGMPACAALLLAARIAAPVVDYAVFSRSHGHRGLDSALGLFGATAMLELGLQTMDGTGAALCWPLIHSAAALLTDVVDGEDSGLSQLSPTVSPSTLELTQTAPGAVRE